MERGEVTKEGVETPLWWSVAGTAAAVMVSGEPPAWFFVGSLDCCPTMAVESKPPQMGQALGEPVGDSCKPWLKLSWKSQVLSTDEVAEFPVSNEGQEDAEGLPEDPQVCAKTSGLMVGLSL
jgi:hypothetical protein